jgi:predicted RNase H-like HicB family nuclease
LHQRADGKVDLSSSGIEGTALMPGYIAPVHKDEGTSYGVSFPDVPGCISAGDTFEEAVANASEALAGHLALMRNDGDPLPVPRAFEQLKLDSEFVEDSADAIVTVVTP